MRRVYDITPLASDTPPSASATEQTFVLSFAQVCRVCGFSASHLDRLRRNDPAFPKAVVLGPRRIGWLQEELVHWLRHSARRAGDYSAPISLQQPPGSAASRQPRGAL